MIEIDLITKHGKKALGMTEQAHTPRGWRARVGEILLEIGIIVFAITLSLWLHNWQEHRHNRARERQFLLGLSQDLGHDITELRGDSLSYVRQLRGMRYFRGLSAATLNKDSLEVHRWVLTSGTWFVPNNSRFEGIKSSGALAILESDALLTQILAYYERTTVNLIDNSKGYAQAKNQFILPFLTQNLDPNETNWVEVMQQRTMQNVLGQSASVQNVLRIYHDTAQDARQLRQHIEVYLADN